MANKYVDLSASNNGDGTTAAQAGSPGGTGAWNSLATMLAAVSSGDVVYIRRVVATSTLASSSTLIGNVTYSGWPMSGDALYSGRPASGTSNGWDADSGTVAEWTYTSASAALLANTSSITLNRLKVKNSATSGTPTAFNHSAGASLVVTNCYFQTTDTTLGSTPVTLKAAPGTGVTSSYTGCTVDCAKTNDTLGALISMSGVATFLNTTLLVGTMGYSVANHPVNILSAGAGSTMINTTLAATTVSGNCEPVLQIACNCFIKNFAITHTTRTASGTGAAWLNITSGVGTVIQGISCTFGTHVVIGSNGNEIEITGWTQRQAVTAGGVQFSSANGNIVTLSGVTFLSGNTSGDVAIGSATSGNTIIARGTVFVTGPVWGANNGSRMFSFDHNQVASNLKIQTYNGTIVASSVARSGGESFSLQATPSDQATGKYPLQVVSPRGRESIWLALSSGARTVTLYFACKNLAPDAGDVWVEAEYANGSAQPVIVSSHAPGTAVTSDASTWVGDSGLTVFKIVLSFTLPSAQAVPLRIFFGKWVASSYCYVDPKPAVT